MGLDHPELFDEDWYAREASRTFASRREALAHYLDSGEEQGHFPNPMFDPGFYRAQLGLNDQASALLHFDREGLRAGHAPNRLFHPEWYRWQNPHVPAEMPAFIHYLKAGGRDFSDPSPLLDMASARQAAGDDLDAVTIIGRILKGDWLPPHGVVSTHRSLVSGQRALLDEAKLERLGGSGGTGRRFLVWVQCKPGSAFFDWFEDGQRDWDLLLNLYGPDDPPGVPAEYVFRQKGTKFTGIFNVWRHLPEVLLGYEYVLFIDDDLLFRYQDVDRLFSVALSEELDLAQASLSQDSHCMWPTFFRQGKSGVRPAGGVEIMMPLISRRLLTTIAPYFMYSVSGFGLDLLMGKLARGENMKIGVIDDVEVCHPKAIDQASGDYYQFLRSYGINAKLELWRIITTFATGRDFLFHE